MNKTFKKYSEYYDLFNENKDYEVESNYIDELIRRYSNKKNCEIYDFGSGTGRHAIEMASKGYQVQGIDSSDEMVKIANERRELQKSVIRKKLEFVTGDIRNFRSKKQRDICISLFHVTSYQISDSDCFKFFTSVAKNLTVGGLFIFDYWYLPAVLNLQPQNRIKVKENEKIKGTRITTSKWVSEEVISVKFDLKIESKLTSEVNELQEVHTMRSFDLDNLIRLMPNNLRHINTYKWLTFVEPTTQDWSAVSVFEKIS